MGSRLFVARSWLIACLAVGAVVGIIFAAYPGLDLQVASWFFDPHVRKFPLAITYDWNLVRRIANWIPFLLLAPAVFALLYKIIFPAKPMWMAPSVVIFLIGSFLIGPGLISNVALKENWGRPRPNKIVQFSGVAHFQPWWRPSSECKRNCSFVSGEASQAYWLVAPATLAPPQLRPAALGAAVVFGTSVGAMRIIFGRHFVTDVVFAGVITIAIVMALYQLLLDPVRRSDARLEQAIERTSVGLHRGIGVVLAGVGAALTRIGETLRQTGQHLRKRIACL
jgi:lipid A 4'-phosphatase